MKLTKKSCITDNGEDSFLFRFYELLMAHLQLLQIISNKVPDSYTI